MKLTFKGNFGTLEMIVDSKGNAIGNYQKSATIAGKYIDQNFSGEWSNKGMSGLVKFTVNDGALEGNWKKGTDEGPMKSKWTGKLLFDDSAPPTKSPAKKVTKAKKEAKEPKADRALLALKAEIDQLYEDGTGDDLKDDLFDEAMELVLREQYCSLALLWDELYAGSYRAQNIIDQLVKAGVLGKLEGNSYTVKEGPYNVPAEPINGYLVAIDKFENNKGFLESDNKVVHHYLWSLYLTEGNGEKCFEMIKHYEEKFETDQWKKLKGHCYANKKWYDSALNAYKDSSEKHYDEIQMIFDDFSVLIDTEKWDEAIVYFEEHLYLSVSKDSLGVGLDYCHALFRSSESYERKGLEQLKEYLEDYPDHKSFLSYAGTIAAWLGEKEKDFDMLDEAIAFYKKYGENEKIAKVKETIKKVKEAKKKTADEAKQALRDAAAAEKQAVKEAAKSAKLRQHKFKSSKGETFCQFCAKDTDMSNYDCRGREHGHNYVLMKVDGSFEPICNKCGCNYHFSEYSCS
jgi:hypothetical protein